ncbi:unnamed protein product [Symbiodinium sp. CCMP2592]|nr:unnamed protein product [Symbiodinium sp. CCMP2592]
MAETDEDLEALLKRLRLERFAGPLADLGAESVADLSYLQDADLEKAGIPVVPRRKILEAAGGQWRVTTSPPAGPAAPGFQLPALQDKGPVPGLPALQDKELPKEAVGLSLKASEPAARHPWESLDEEEGFELSSEAKDELKLLMRDLRNLREDFATVNCLDLNSRNHLQSLPSRVALRSMGLLGCGNTFYMEGIRKPGAALAARARGAALDERKPGAKKAEPFEEWVKLLESFAAANKLSEATRNSLEGLDRTQALRVMGFTTALRFLAGPVVRGEAELEVSTRLWAAKSDAPMEAVLPRGDTEPTRGAGATKRDRSRSRRRASDSLPGLSRHVDTFIELNDLDERTSTILRKLEAKTVLQVMGLAGAENSFLLRGVREKSKAVLNRLRKVQEIGQDAELFGQLSKVMEARPGHGRLTGPGSGEEAAQAISALAPRQVMVELCQRRYGQVMTSLQMGLPMRPPSKLDLLGNVHGGLLQHELAPILQAARSVGAAILPIDRPQSATRSRVAHRLWHPKLLQGLLSFAGYSLRKQRDSLSPAQPYDAEEIRRELERCCPVAHDVLIDERSFYLAQQVAVSSVPDTDVAVVCSAPMSTYLVSALRQVPDLQKAKDPQAGATRLLKLAKRGVPVWPLYAFAYGLVPAGLTAFAAVCFWDAFLYPALFQEMSSQPEA